MTRLEAAKIFDVAPNSKPRQINAAYNALRHKYVRRAHYSTIPRERDEANTALVLLQDAYRVLTKKKAPARIKPSRAATTTPSSRIPRASLGGASPRSHEPARRRFRAVADKGASSTSAPRGDGASSRPQNTPGRRRPATIENKTAFVICTAMYVLALWILGKTLSCTL